MIVSNYDIKDDLNSASLKLLLDNIKVLSFISYKHDGILPIKLLDGNYIPVTFLSSSQVIPKKLHASVLSQLVLTFQF